MRSLFVGAAIASAALQLVAFSDPRVSNVENEGVLFASVVARQPPQPSDPVAGWAAPFTPWKKLFADADPLLATGLHLLLDTDTAPHAPLFSRHPRQLVIPEDRDFEQILAAPSGRVDLVAVPATAGQRGSRYFASIQAVVSSNLSQGTWRKVGTYDSLTLYQFIPN